MAGMEAVIIKLILILQVLNNNKLEIDKGKTLSHLDMKVLLIAFIFLAIWRAIIVFRRDSKKHKLNIEKHKRLLHNLKNKK